MSHLFLLRHGDTTTPGRFCGSTDTMLSEEGWQQMWCAVENQTWDRIVRSPARRCSEFGITLARCPSTSHFTDARLREMHFGDCQRVLEVWQEMAASDSSKRCLIITHGGPMRILRSVFDPCAATNLLDIDVPHASLWDTRLWPACAPA